MSLLVNVNFIYIWILTSIVIEKDDIKNVDPYRAYCKEVKLYKVPSQLYPKLGAEGSCVTQVHIHR